MPLSTVQANAKTEAVNAAFADIGNSTGTSMPRSKANLEPTAWEYFMASHLARLADARKALAVKNAVKAGIMFDPAKQPMPEGTNALTYAGEVVEISVGVTTPVQRLDTDAFIDDLEKSGVARKVLDRLAAKHTHANRAPHKFTATLATVR